MGRMALAEQIQLHRQFWAGTNEQMLLAKMPPPAFVPQPYHLADGRVIDGEAQLLHPQLISPETMIPRTQPIPPLTCGTMFQSVRCGQREAWMEALCGCELWANSSSCTARPLDRAVIDEVCAGFSVARALESPWLTVMDRTLQWAVERANGTHPVPQLHLRGVIDMLAARLGEETLCIACIESPEAVKQLAAAYAELYIHVAQRGLAQRPTWHGCYISVWNVLAPDSLVDYQIDASSLMSTAMYGELFAEADRMVFDAFDFTVSHLHYCGLAQAEHLLDYPGAMAVQISLDRETGSFDMDTLLHYARLLQAHGLGIILAGQLTDEEFEQIGRALSPRGLAITWQAME